MPSFLHTVTIIGLLIGPAGVGLGWWLSELSKSRTAKQADVDLVARETRERVVGLIEAARRVNDGSRSLGHSFVISKVAGRPVSSVQKGQIIEESNVARAELDLLILNVRILGPEWIVEDALTVSATGSEMVGVLSDLEIRVTANSLDEIQELLVRHDKEIESLVESAKVHYATT